MKLLGILVSMLFFSSLVHGQAVDVGVGYSVLDLQNPNQSTSRSTGLGLSLGGYYSFFKNDFLDVGLKASGFYANLKNDITSASLNEKTEYYNLGGGLEVSVKSFFLSWQRKYNRMDIQLSGQIENTSAFSGSVSQWEVGYDIPMNSMSVRFAYQYIASQWPRSETGLSADSDFKSSSIMVILRFQLGNSATSSSEKSTGIYTESSERPKEPPEYTPGFRTYRYAPRPSNRIRY